MIKALVLSLILTGGDPISLRWDVNSFVQVIQKEDFLFPKETYYVKITWTHRGKKVVFSLPWDSSESWLWWKDK